MHDVRVNTKLCTEHRTSTETLNALPFTYLLCFQVILSRVSKAAIIRLSTLLSTSMYRGKANLGFHYITKWTSSVD